ncbi:MAG: Xaa-Pro aminopeptidase [Candidatus Marinimicrobia bacterium]|nr:Xaa-Pro aminopeptidase [Candidatus Neomarinimicrobiota bacterium]
MMKKLKKILDRYGIDGYIVPKNDEFFNEYVPKSKDRLKFISNFSGSAGFSIILKNKNYLFVDGRYSTQAKYQSGNKFKIFTIPEELPKKVIKTNKKIILGFDPKLHTEKQLNFFFNIKNIILRPINENLIDMIWPNRAKELVKPFYLISSKKAGKNSLNKVQQVRKILLKNKLDYLLVTASENVAWLLNIRGQDTSHAPIPNSRLLISKRGTLDLFVNPNKLGKLKNIKIQIHDEKNMQRILNSLSKEKILLDSMSCSFFFKQLLGRKNKIIERIDPIHFLKSIKNNIEIKNMKLSHLKDGVALTKFLIWLKKNFKSKIITEISAEKKLESFRKMNSSYKFPSFSTISGSGPNSAIIHYKASSKTNRKLKKGELYLVDSGGQYHFGTTDVTRTISLDNNSKYIKEIYTRVLKGHIAVSKFKIKKNSTGADVDQIARKSLKKINLDYPHGTGHGVGYFLNVHEGPQSISKNNKINLQNGMVLSNEPGFYKEGLFGVRIENLVYINKNRFNELTIVPIEKDLINKKILNDQEIKWINNYHLKVKKNLLKFMSRDEKIDLIKACSPI